MAKTNDILHNLKYSDAEQKRVFCSMPKVAERKLHSVEYYFDIIHTVNDNQIEDYRRRFNQDGYNCLPFPIDDVKEGVELCKEMCANLGIEFTADHENILNNKNKGNGRIYLTIIERPIYIG